jgi:MFS family permease
VSEKSEYGKNAGFFTTCIMLGNTLGIFVFGFLVLRLSYNWSFVIYALFPFVGLILLTNLKRIKESDSNKQFKNQFVLLRHSIKNVLVCKLSLFWFYSFFIRALFVGVVPIKIKHIFGSEEYIGMLCSMYYLAPILLSFIIGKISDKMGRKFMIFLAYSTCVIGLFLIYFCKDKTVLTMGVAISAISFSINRPLNIALIGDITTERNIDSLLAFFTIVQNIGFITAFVLPLFVKYEMIYLVASLVTCTTGIIVWTVLENNTFAELQTKLDKELSTVR